MADEKPRVRVSAGSRLTVDSFVNVNQRLGLGSGSQMDGAGYAFNYITRQRAMLEAAYRTSWIVGKSCDAPAEDMTKAGVSFNSSLDPKSENLMHAAWRDLSIGDGLADGIRWGRLYGGAPVLMMIADQDLSTPMRIDTVGRGQFKGLYALDRWSCQADTTSIVKEFGPDFGLPEYYIISADVNQGWSSQQRVHHSRVLRFIGNKLPYYQRPIENLWGESVIERIWDRVLAFDSTTTGAAQLVFKAHLRTMKIKEYRQLIAAGGKMYEAVMQQMEHVRFFQNTEGLTVLDADDEFETHSYTFAGLDDIIVQMGDQVCGAVEIPRVRLFGESPGGLNADGESALRTYYDDTNKKQEKDLRRPVTTVLDVLGRSTLGAALPEGFNFSFNPLWLMSDKDRADIAKTTTEAVTMAYEKNVVTQQAAMKELKNSSRVTGIWSNITDEDIEAAEDTIPDPVEMAANMAEATGEPNDDKPTE